MEVPIGSSHFFNELLSIMQLYLDILELSVLGFLYLLDVLPVFLPDSVEMSIVPGLQASQISAKSIDLTRLVLNHFILFAQSRLCFFDHSFFVYVHLSE